MEYKDLLHFLQHVGKDPSRLIFEDELTGVYNRRFLLNYFQYKVDWDGLEGHPLSLLMLDVDNFKQINDTHGHTAGDQALIWVAALLRETVGEKGHAIRYAGDEFILLLPRFNKKTAKRVGDRLLELVRKRPVLLEEKEGEFSITLSIGIASAPDDAQTGKDLIHSADTALYYAKKAGRDQWASAGDIPPQHVFDKTALHQLEQAKIAGRELHLKHVAAALQKFEQRQNQFLIVEGAAGMGKTEFLQTVQQNLDESDNWQVAVRGNPQELFRPYYLTTNILIEILNKLPDKGVSLLESLKPKEILYLSHVIPQLGETEDYGGEDDQTQREGLFTTLVHFISKILGTRPLHLFIDDLDFTDEATLLLLRRLILEQRFPIFICAASTDTHQEGREHQPAPLERFYSTYCKELDIHKVSLTPLTAANIVEHLAVIFPKMELPQNFETALAQTTQGNPLFLNEILRKLVMDKKISLIGNQWIAEPLEEGYLPKSLEEIVNQKIAALDEENRQLLDQASTFGENVALSVLSGSSQEMEAKVLEFVDQAVAQGLVSSEFQLNDEIISFLGKRVLDITYGAIEDDRKQELHEHVGNYQEVLYEQRLIPSAATLAYHFKRSTNQEKAGNYEQMQATSNKQIFNATEAIHYTAERSAEAAPEVTPLDKDSIPLLPTIIRSLLTVVRNIKLYPPGSKTIVTANRQMKEMIDKFLASNEQLSFFAIKDALIVNGQKIDVSEFKYFADSFIKFLSLVELKGLAFKKGLTEDELQVLLEAFGRAKPDIIDQDFWQRFAGEKSLVNIELTQVRYTVVSDAPDQTLGDQVADGEGAVSAAEISAQLEEAEQGLDAADIKDVPEVIRGLLNAARSIKLYPLKSKAISSAIGLLLQSLQSILKRKPALTLASVGDSLLVNGEKVDISEFETLAQSFLKFLGSLALTSLTFLASVSSGELETFIGSLAELPAVGLDGNFWARLAKDHGLSSILFDQRLYEARVSASRLTSRESGTVKVKKVAKIAKPIEMAPSEAGETFDKLAEKMPVRMSDLLLQGDEDQVKRLLKRLLQEFLRGDLQIRQKVVDRCHSMLEGLNLGLQNQLAKLMANLLLVVFTQEKDPIILRELANLLHRLATILIQFGEYPPASRIILNLHRRHGQLIEAKTEQAPLLEKILLRPLEPKAQQLILDDFRSADPTRRQSAAQLLSSMGRASLPLLVNIIKNEEDLRIRQLAASLVAEHGLKAAKLLKRELSLQTTADERIRILEVIDSITRDLRTELAYALTDENSEVREVALQLAERLNDDQVGKLLLDQTENEELDVALAAVKSLGKLNPPTANNKLITVLQSNKNQELVVACCKSLGLIADPASIDPLAKLLGTKGLFRRKQHSAEVRARAALALAQIKHPRVAAVLANYINDNDPRVRQVASSLKLPPSKLPEKNQAVAQ